MRWIARRKAAWVVAAALAAVGPGRPGEPAPAWSPTVGTPAPATAGRLKHDAPERAGPPILIPPPDVAGAPPPAGAELVPGPPIVIDPPDVTRAPPPTRAELPHSPGQVRVLAVAAARSTGATEPVPAVLPPSAPPEEVEVVPAPPVLPMLPAVPPPPAEGPPCPNPWAKVPVVQPFPRLGLFLVPGSGPGYYSFADLLHGNWREKPPAFPYPPFALQPPSGFDADYRYLDNPANTQVDPFDVVKRVHPTPDTMVTVGGQHSARYMYEVDSRLTPRDNTYLLYRNRVWADVRYRDQVRVYGEFISAQIAGNELPPLPTDVNRADIQNLFVELQVAEVDGQPVHVRVGRQEMLFGSQRLVSTLDWANTRRTFEGVRGFTRGEAFDLDLFWTRPVVVEPGDPDSADEEVPFYGAWATYRPAKGQLVDVYYLGLTDDRLTRDRFFPAGAAPRGTVEVHTFGARYAGNDGPLLFDFEGMVQTGHYVRREHCAYAWVTALGWEFQDHPWRPQVWAAYDYYSGTPDPVAGDHRTFNQLFPFGHYYLGYLDVVGQQNIRDLNFQVAAYPDHWITLVFQWHHFRLAEERDFLYNAAGRPTRRSPTGAAGSDVGREFDVRANFHLTAHQDLLVGYSKLFAGDFIRATGPAVSPELFYLMYNFRW